MKNAWSPEEFEKNLRQAPARISCAWGVGTVRSKSTRRWTTALVFHDDDHNQFSYCFEFESEGEVYHLAKLLLDTRDFIKKKLKE